MTLEFLQRKYPPHFAPVHRHNTPVVLFVTIAIQPRVNALANDAVHAIFQRVLKEADAWRAFLYVMMPDHIHIFVVPQTVTPYPIAKWVGFLKRRITQMIQNTHAAVREDADPPEHTRNPKTWRNPKTQKLP